MRPAITKITSTFPAALASAHSASSASGSSTSCTQRGMTTRGGAIAAALGGPARGSSGGSRSCSSGADVASPRASGAFSETPLTYLPPSPEYG